MTQGEWIVLALIAKGYEVQIGSLRGPTWAWAPGVESPMSNAIEAGYVIPGELAEITEQGKAALAAYDTRNPGWRKKTGRLARSLTG